MREARLFEPTLEKSRPLTHEAQAGHPEFAYVRRRQRQRLNDYAGVDPTSIAHWKGT